MLNLNSDWPHGSVDAALIIAFAWGFSPHFNICCNMQCDEEENSFLVMRMMLVTARSPTVSNMREWFLPHQHNQPTHCCWQSPRADGSKSRECATAVLTTLAGQGGICHRERNRVGKRRERRLLEHNRFQYMSQSRARVTVKQREQNRSISED